jgi:hypothetical protein
MKLPLAPSHVTSLFTFGGLVAALVFTGCTTTGPTPRSRNANTPPRTELVLLNVPEGSGWVAYRRQDDTDQVEDYRIVVIRQSTDELIYDSVIPLAASVATHGFELAKDDPRLQNLAQNVDRNIITPLENVMPQLADSTAPAPVATPAPQPVMESEPVSPEPAITPPTPEVVMEEVASPEPPVYPQLEDSDQEYPLLRVNGDQVIIGMPAEGSLSPRDRLFVREADRTITLPGEQEQQLVSRGSLTGLIQVESVQGRIATTILLSGYMPENPIFELNE